MWIRPLFSRALTLTSIRATTHCGPLSLLLSKRTNAAAFVTMTDSDKKLSVLLGTMTFGWNQASSKVDDQKATEMVDAFLSAGHNEIDTAYMYAGGETEKILGRILHSKKRIHGCLVATKANPWTQMPKTGNLTPEKTAEQLNTSLERMKVESCDTFYLHAPDTSTRIESTLEAVDKLHKAGKFKVLGLSNYQSWEVVHIWHVCDKNGWVKPTVYQGMYNPITREIERELIPALRKLGMRLVVYNPLAAGLLTGKHDRDNVPEGRFKNNKMYMSRFWKDSFFNSLDLVKKACDEEKIKMSDAAFYWLQYHSKLSTELNDGVIIGASNMDHLKANLKALKNSKPLPESIVTAFNEAWKSCKHDCPSYERGYSKI
eukprot:GFYU01007731.1.p1 GENE.GFYU01007731.1~~GFYU01007731.1.p1  ORF type:complete len:373 (+),score=103.99 GFYU01007731.1:34-1152(+)